MLDEALLIEEEETMLTFRFSLRSILVSSISLPLYLRNAGKTTVNSFSELLLTPFYARRGTTDKTSTFYQ